jgi:uroporphyrinogen decarboxylase
MPEYRHLRKNRSLVEMFHDVETIVKVTCLPIKLLEVDAAILFSDILSVLDGLQLEWSFEEGRGPVIPQGIERGKLPEIQPAHLAYPHIVEAIQLLKHELKVPLIGFAGGPFTIASYLIEKGSSKDLKETKKWLYQDAASFHHLLEIITEATIDYLNVQIDSGVDALQLFDSWAHVLGVNEFREFCLPYMQKILKGLKKQIPLILFCRGSCLFAQDLAALKPACISLDWSLEISDVRTHIPSTIALQGNLDPMTLYGAKETIRQKASEMLKSMEGDSGYIFNLGHGILPDIAFDNVKFLVDYVKSY